MRAIRTSVHSGGLDDLNFRGGLLLLKTFLLLESLASDQRQKEATVTGKGGFSPFPVTPCGFRTWNLEQSAPRRDGLDAEDESGDHADGRPEFRSVDEALCVGDDFAAAEGD